MLGFNLQSDCIFGAGATTQRCQDTVGHQVCACSFGLLIGVFRFTTQASGFVPTPATVTQWDPYQIDVEQWIQIASSFGAKYIGTIVEWRQGPTR
jgi:hypothetical protein